MQSCQVPCAGVGGNARASHVLLVPLLPAGGLGKGLRFVGVPSASPPLADRLLWNRFILLSSGPGGVVGLHPGEKPKPDHPVSGGGRSVWGMESGVRGPRAQVLHRV